jgi:hypothetical protein
MHKQVIDIIHKMDEPTSNFDNNIDSIAEKLKVIKAVLDMDQTERDAISLELDELITHPINIGKAFT